MKRDPVCGMEAEGTDARMSRAKRKSIAYGALGTGALLAGGFGLQLGLFVFLKTVVREQMAGATAEVAAATLLAQYQTPLILLGVFSNLAGLTVMVGLVRKHRLLAEERLINRINMKAARLVVIVFGVAAIAYSTHLAR
jgi:hypothetical protein